MGLPETTLWRLLPVALAILLFAGAPLMPATHVYAESGAGDGAKRVQTATFGELAFYPEYSVAAEVIAKDDSTISAEVAAVVASVKHDTGETVSRGAVVIQLDCREYELQLQQAQAHYDAVKAQLENANKLFDSAKKLQQQNNIARETYNQREADQLRLKADSASARAGVDSARLAVSKCAITAPYDGYISERHVSTGEHVMPGTPVYRMVTSAQGSLEAHINHYQYRHFQNGVNHRFTHAEQTYPVVIAHILPVLDRDFRTHTARLAFVKEAAPTGSHGSLLWNDSRRAIASSLVVMRDGKAGVFVANDNHAHFVPVSAYTEGQPAYVDLEDDARVITTGRFGLKPGDAISTD